MIRNPRLTLLTFAVCFISNTVAASYSSSLSNHHQAPPHNYKGEIDYKQELPTEPIYNCSDCKTLHDGFYVGGGVGYDVYKFNQRTAITDDGITTTLDPNLNGKGWNGNVFLGYGRNYEWFYLGAEIMALDSNANSTYSLSAIDAGVTDSYQVKTKARWSYGAGLLPGVKVNDSSLLYGRIGYVRTSFRSTETATSGIENVNITKNSWLNGFNYGLGIETVVYPTISLRAEYTYTSFNAMTSAIGTKFTPSDNQFVLSAIYHFSQILY